MAPPRTPRTLVCPICGNGIYLAPAHQARGSTRHYCSRACSQSDAAIQARCWRRIAVCQHGRTCPVCCWEWQGGYSVGGYGVMLERKTVVLSHRYIFQLTYGPFAPGLSICHRCDNPPCCNPAHLFCGTHAENMQDARQKGRAPEGERHASSKLTQAQVAAIRAAVTNGRTQRQLATQFGVEPTTIWHVVHGDSWKKSLDADTPARPIRHPLTAAQVQAIRDATSQGESSRSIARRMGIGKSTVGAILRGERHY